jgi:hypothetical protein
MHAFYCVSGAVSDVRLRRGGRMAAVVVKDRVRNLSSVSYVSRFSIGPKTHARGESDAAGPNQVIKAGPTRLPSRISVPIESDDDQCSCGVGGCESLCFSARFRWFDAGLSSWQLARQLWPRLEFVIGAGWPWQSRKRRASLSKRARKCQKVGPSKISPSMPGALADPEPLGLCNTGT